MSAILTYDDLLPEASAAKAGSLPSRAVDGTGDTGVFAHLLAALGSAHYVQTADGARAYLPAKGW